MNSTTIDFITLLVKINALSPKDYTSKRSIPQPFKNCAGFNGVEYLIKTHQKTCETIYKSKKFWTALKSNKYDLFVTQLLGSGCDAYIAHELQVPMIAITTSAMPTWYARDNVISSNTVRFAWYEKITFNIFIGAVFQV